MLGSTDDDGNVSELQPWTRVTAAKVEDEGSVQNVTTLDSHEDSQELHFSPHTSVSQTATCGLRRGKQDLTSSQALTVEHTFDRGKRLLSTAVGSKLTKSLSALFNGRPAFTPVPRAVRDPQAARAA